MPVGKDIVSDFIGDKPFQFILGHVLARAGFFTLAIGCTAYIVMELPGLGSVADIGGATITTSNESTQ